MSESTYGCIVLYRIVSWRGVCRDDDDEEEKTSGLSLSLFLFLFLFIYKRRRIL